MEPNKIENQFREKLNSREIKPNPMSWDRLDAMLSITEGKKSKRSFSWIFIAASFIGFLIIGTVFYQYNSKEIKPNSSVVDRENNLNTNSNQKNNSANSVEDKAPQNTQIVQAIKPIIVNQQLTVHNKNTIINQKTTVTKINQNQEEVVLIVPSKKEIIPVNTQPNNAVTGTNFPEKNNLVSKIKINPNTLLSQIDGELDQSFRETRLEKIKRNFQTIKVAIATRNQE